MLYFQQEVRSKKKKSPPNLNIHVVEMKMSKRSKLRGILRFPETSVTRWRESLRGGSWSEVLEAIVVPQNSASQLKAVKKVL